VKILVNSSSKQVDFQSLLGLSLSSFIFAGTEYLLIYVNKFNNFVTNCQGGVYKKIATFGKSRIIKTSP